MSVGFNPKNQITMDQSLEVQELVVSGVDHGLYQISGSDCYVMIREPVDKVFLVSVKVDSSNLVTQFQQSSISIVDSSSLTVGPPNNKGAIKIAGLSSVADNDVIVLRYRCNE